MSWQIVILIVSTIILILGVIMFILSRKQNEQQIAEQKNIAEQLRARVDELSIKLATAESDLKHEKAKNEELKIENQKEQEKIQSRLQLEFEQIAQRVLKSNSQDFRDQSAERIGNLLNPLNKSIIDFKQQVESSFSRETAEKASLKTELQQLLNLNRTLSEEANNLSNALRGEVKAQGNWGEFVLERVLEASGLRKGEEYTREEVVTGTNGETLRPDVIIHLPDNKHIIVDSKVSLTAYERLQHADSEAAYEQIMKDHLRSVKAHVDELYRKQYQQSKQLNSPDYVLMFVPIEASFTTALQYDSSLYNYALEKHIVIVSPTTLLATLQTIAYIWKQDNQNKNALEIARLAGTMYDKLAGALQDFEKVDKGIADAKKAYDESYKKIFTGNGNVLRTAEKTKKLGASATKRLPEELELL